MKILEKVLGPIFIPASIALCILPTILKPPSKPWQQERKYDFHLVPGFPEICAGDEPAHLILLNSLVNDFDFDLSNNYAGVHRGSMEAGRAYAGTALDHHTVFPFEGVPIHWGEVFHGWNSPGWGKEPGGHPVPKRKQYVSSDVEGLPEYTFHTIGIPILLAPLAFPFRNTPYVEQAALVGSLAALILCLFLFRNLSSRFSSNRSRVHFATAAAIFATPVWHYGKSLFPEAFLSLCTVGAYALAFGRPGHPIGASLLIGVAILLKPIYALLAIPIGLYYIFKLDLKKITLLPIGPALAVLIMFAMNYSIFGSISTFQQGFPIGDLRQSVPGVLFDRQHGLFPFAPIVLIALLGWPRFIRDFPREALAILGGCLCIFAVAVLWYDWRGGWCYGPRPIIPIIPLLCTPLVFIRVPKHRLWKVAFLSICGISFVIGTLAAFYHLNTMNIHPLLPFKWFLMDSLKGLWSG